MRRRNMPVRNLARLVKVRAKVRHNLCLVKGIEKTKIGGSGVDGVGIQNHQPIHLARIQIPNQRLQIANLIGRYRACCLA